MSFGFVCDAQRTSLTIIVLGVFLYVLPLFTGQTGWQQTNDYFLSESVNYWVFEMLLVL